MHLFINCIACKVWDGHSNKLNSVFSRLLIVYAGQKCEKGMGFTSAGLHLSKQ
jgi:hypothetical protein